MKRREFMQRSAAGVTVAGGIGEALLIPSEAEAQARRKPLVAVAGSDDPSLAHPAHLDEVIDYDQVRAVVRLALDRDTSDRNLPALIKKDSWVVIKPNIVTIPVKDPNGDAWLMIAAHQQGTEHWGLVTDLRVIKVLAEYIVEKIGPRRLTIAEGPPWFSSGGKNKPEKFVDGWHCRWKAFDNLSYAAIVEELNGRNGTLVDIVDLNEDEPVYVTNFDPHNTGRGAFQMVPGNDPDASVPGTPSRRKGIYMPRTVVDRDILITCPVLKVHAGAGVTLCMKNFVGTVHAPAYVKNDKNNLKVMIHQGNECNLMRVVADLGTVVNPDYAVVEGFWATEQSFLSQNGCNLNHNVVAAGGDATAVEAVSMQLMGFNPLDADVLRRCHMKQLGEWHPDRIEVAGPPVRYLAHNYIRQNGFYVARGVRHWLMLPAGPAVQKPQGLEPGEGARVGAVSWMKIDGDTIMDDLPHLQGMQAQDAMRWPLPGSETANSGDHILLATRVTAPDNEYCGQLIVGLVGAEFRAFLNGAAVRYDRAGLTYDPSPLGWLRMQKGENLLVIDITKSAAAGEPVRFAANVCDFDGDRLPGVTFDPPNE